MPKYKVLVCQFPGGNATHIAPTKWVMGLSHLLANDPRVGLHYFDFFDKADTPITMTRNQAMARAEAYDADFVVMIDSDMWPDCISPQDGAKLFWQSSWDFMLENRAGMIAAPYCGPSPEECVYVFRWNTNQDQQPNPNMRLEMYDRDTASKMRGIQKAAALPTGLCIISMKAAKEMKKPYFDYEWKDRYGRGEEKCPHCHTAIPGERVDKASTEDVFFSRNLTYAGWPVYCNWDAWAAHIKLKLVGPPQRVPESTFPQMMRKWADDLPASPMNNPYPDPGAVSAAAVDDKASDTVIDLLPDDMVIDLLPESLASRLAVGV